MLGPKTIRFLKNKRPIGTCIKQSSHNERPLYVDGRPVHRLKPGCHQESFVVKICQMV